MNERSGIGGDGLRRIGGLLAACGRLAACSGLLIVLLAAVAAPGAECLRNGDFEASARGWIHEHWTGKPAPGQVVDDDVYAGGHAYRMHNADYDKTNFLLKSFTYTPGETYRLRLAIKGEGLAEKGVFVRILCLRHADGKDKVLSFAKGPDGQINFIQAGGTFPWQVFTAEILPEYFPEGTNVTNLYIYHAPNNQGCVWIDEVSVSDSRPEPLKPLAQRPALSLRERQSSAAAGAGTGAAQKHAANIWPGDASFETGSEHLRLPRDKSVPAWHGEYSLRFGAGQKRFVSKYLFLLLRPDRQYRVSFYVRSDRPGKCAFFSWDTSWKTLIHQYFQVDNEWRRVSFAFPVNKTLTSPTIGFDKNSEQTLWIDAIQISEGEELPDFTMPGALSVGMDDIGDIAGFLAPAATSVPGTLRLRNNADEAQNVRLEALLSNVDGQDQRLLEREISLPAGALHEEVLTLMPTCERGYYVVRLRASSPGGVATCDLPFAVMDEPLPPRADSYFGQHIGPMTHCRRIGASWLRDYRNWRRKKDGRNDFTGIGRAAQEYGMFELECIGVTGAPPECRLKDSDPPGLPDPVEQERFIREFALAIPEGSCIELHNEPDLAFAKYGLVNGVERYCESLERLVPQIRQVRPDLKVHAAGVSGDDCDRGFPFLEGVLARAGQHIDVLPVHPYAGPRYICADGADIGPEAASVYENTMRMREIIAGHGGQQPIWYGEVGWALSVEEDYLSAAAMRHAAYCVRLMLLGMSAKVERVLYFLMDAHIERQRYYYGLWRSNRPLPAAAAYAATAQVLDGAKGELLIANSDLHCFSYRHRDGRLFAALWTSMPDGFAAEIALPPASVEVRDMFNRPLACPAGDTVKLALSGRPQYLFCGADLSEDAFHAALRTMRYDCPPLSFAWQLQRADCVAVLVSNLRQQALNGRCRLDGAEFAAPERDLSLAPGESVMLSFESPSSLNQLTLTMSAQTNLGDLVGNYRARIMACPRTTEGARLLNAAALPASAGRLPSLSTRDYLLPNDPGNGWAGPQDLSMEGAVAYDDEQLYLLLDVHDDIHCQRQKPGNLWKQDSVQVGIDSLANALPYVLGYGQDDYEFGFGLTPEGPVVEVSQLYEVGRLREVQAAITARVERHDDVTRYRIAIPWSELKLVPRQGMILGMNVIANDDDGHGRRFWMGLTSGIAEKKNPYVFVKFSLE
ncbi:MAG: hypothetical protein GX945_03905 [Lentisphaerae bacterium]|nr:hypothetical protein [Lentisphaerota bacterium]